MTSQKISITLLIFGFFIFNIPLKANIQVKTEQLTTVKNQFHSVTSRTKSKIKYRLFKKLKKSSKQEKDISEKIKRNANLALAFGFGAFAGLFATVLLFQVAILFIPIAFALIMGFVFAIKARRQIREVDEDFFQEQSKAKIGLIFSFLTLCAPVLMALITLAFWW